PSTAALFSEREWGDVEVIFDTSGRFDNTPNQTKPKLNPVPIHTPQILTSIFSLAYAPKVGIVVKRMMSGR
ncbi:MAG: hypothetical protein NC429_03445, partial [Lachnospiraceae bacterium]|nr:hypothetical protein [Lachnospiraceae bacterium]